MMWCNKRLALGALLAGGFLAYYAELEASCANMSGRDDGGGELVITSGGDADGTKTGTRLLGPRFAFSRPLDANASARLLHIADLCQSLLDCASCPPSRRPAFNTSILDNVILISSLESDVRLYVCGTNRVARVLGQTGIAGFAIGRATENHFLTPGFERQKYRVGAHRDSLPRDGDVGVAFPVVHVSQYSLNPILEALEGGLEVNAALTPTAPNPWYSAMCGYWKPLRTTLMLGQLWVAERAASCFIGHVRSAGVRIDLAQAASMTEVVAHLLFALSLHDPFLSFHWGALPFGTYPAAVICPIVLMCSSTLYLAAFWSQMIASDGLASVVCETRQAWILSGTAHCMNVLAIYFFLTEVSSHA